MLTLFPEIPKRDENLKTTPLSERTGIPVCFIQVLPPRLIFLLRQSFVWKKRGERVGSSVHRSLPIHRFLPYCISVLHFPSSCRTCISTCQPISIWKKRGERVGSSVHRSLPIHRFLPYCISVLHFPSSCRTCISKCQPISSLLDYLWLRKKMKFKFYFRFFLRCKKPDINILLRFSLSCGIWETHYESFFVFGLWHWK